MNEFLDALEAFHKKRAAVDPYWGKEHLRPKPDWVATLDEKGNLLEFVIPHPDSYGW